MPKVHDRGGWPNDDPIDHDEHEMEEWERQVDALNGVLGDKGLKNTDPVSYTHLTLPTILLV